MDKSPIHRSVGSLFGVSGGAHEVAAAGNAAGISLYLTWVRSISHGLLYSGIIKGLEGFRSLAENDLLP